LSTKIPKSPKKVCVRAASRFPNQSVRQSRGSRFANVWKNPPPITPFCSSARPITSGASVGILQSTWRKSTAVPAACRAPAFIWTPRPRGEETTTILWGNDPAAASSARHVPSVLPPSTTISSSGPGRLPTWARNPGMFPSSLSTGVMIESIRDAL
jgi:hypothetical protein